jgi:protein SCO1/2
MPKQAPESDQTRATRLLILALFLFGVPVIAILIFLSLAPARQPSTDTGAAIVEGTPYDGSTAVDPPRELQDFTLTTHTGEPLSLIELRGQVVLMYFGYTHCPDFCPSTLLNFQRIRELLGDSAEDVRFLFISVDPDRDTPRVIAEYLESQGVATFVTGMAGEDAVLQQIAPDYGLYYGIQPGMELEQNYLVDHSTLVYLADREGRLATIFIYGTEPDVIAGNVREMLRE